MSNTIPFEPLQLWFDTDPGFDDWMAWLLIEALPEHFKLHGVSVVAGNAPLSRTWSNALKIKAFHGFQTPLYKGCDRPLAQAQTTAQDVLGDHGMSTTGAQLPEVGDVADVGRAQPGDELPIVRNDRNVSNLGNDSHPSPGPLSSGDASGSATHGVQAFIDCVRANPGRITLLAVGPLTNIAVAFALDPGLPALLKDIVIMGGSTVGGNATAAAEFNIYADPEAAARVFECGRDVAMFGLNVCAKVRVGDSQVQQVRALGTRQAEVFAAYLDGYVDIGRKAGRTAQSVYDPTPVMWLAHPEWFVLQHGRVDVETAGRFTRGMTVCDLRPKALARANARVATEARGPEALAWTMAALMRRLA